MMASVSMKCLTPSWSSASAHLFGAASICAPTPDTEGQTTFASSKRTATSRTPSTDA